MATYAIGDVQGCDEQLAALLGEIGFSASRDRLWLVGDLINRGPNSLDALRRIMALGDAATVVLGNHDLHFLMVASGHGRHHKEDTFDEILAAPDRDDLVKWLRCRRMLYREDDHVMVHAGLLPSWTAAKAEMLASEVEATLSGDRHDEFMARMWGSEPAGWSDDLDGWDRLRVVVNAMTRLRFCDAAGNMEFRSKGPPDRPPPGCSPWFRAAGRASADHTVIFGHWSALGFMLQPRLIALDSGCLWGGALTAVRLEDRRVFQLTCPRARRPGGTA